MMQTTAEPPPKGEPRKSLLDRMIDCRDKEIRHEPCEEDKRTSR